MRRLKGILAAVMTLVTAIGVTATAADEGYIKAADQTGVTVVSYEDSVNADLLVAQYDKYGRLESVKVNELELSSGEALYKYSELGFGEEIPSGAKVMLWNSDGVEPMSKMYESKTVVRKDILEFPADRFESASEGSHGYEISFYNDNYYHTSTDYSLSDDMKMYINGVEFADTFGNFFREWVRYCNKNTSMITLTDVPDENGVYDEVYDCINLDMYAVALVDDVEVDGSEILVYFSKSSEDSFFDLNMDETGSEVAYEIYLDGKRVPAYEIQAGDILTALYDISTGNCEASSFMKLYISRDTYTGKLRAIDSDEGEYTFDNGESYKLAYQTAARLENGTSYTLHFDAFGNIAAAEEVEEPVQYAILENVYETNGGADCAVTIITPEAEKRYLVDSYDYEDLIEVLMGYNTDYYNTSEKMEYRAPVHERVIVYRVNNDGTLRLLDHLDYSKEIEREYKAATEKLATTKIYDTTSFIDLSDYADTGIAYKLSKDMLVDGGEYHAYSYETRSNSIYNLILVLSRPEEAVEGDRIVYEENEEPEDEEVVIPAEGYAILENVYYTNGGADYAATIITSAGKAMCLVDNGTYDELLEVLTTDDWDGQDSVREYIEDVWNRVIRYEIKSNGELRYIGTAEYENKINGGFDASAGMLDTVKISEENTVLIDVYEYQNYGSDAVIMEYSDLVNGSSYKGYAFGLTEDDTASLVLVTAGMSGLNVNSSVAVYVSSVVVDTDDGVMDGINAYVNGELVTLLTDMEHDMVTGDVFFYTRDRDGYVNKIVTVLDESVYSVYRDFYEYALESDFNTINDIVAAGFAGEDDTIEFDRPGDASDCELVFGAIVDCTNNEVALAQATYKDGTAADFAAFNIDKARKYNIADNAMVYKYDYDYSRLKDRVSWSSVATLNPTSFPTDAYLDDDKETIDLTADVMFSDENDNYGRVRLALLKIVNGEVKEAVVYVPSSEKN